MALAAHSAAVKDLDEKVGKLLREDLTMTQGNYHDYTGYKQEIADAIENYYGMLSGAEERTLAYLKAEVGSRLRQLADYLLEHGKWPA